MDDIAWLGTPAGQQALAEASGLPDTEAPGAVARMRARYGQRAAAVLTQASLRRAARVKFGAAAERWFYTRAGLEQATRPAVAAHRAATYVAAGATRVLDLGCGIGTDAWAFLDAGLEVVAVEIDPVTAAVAAANLAPAVAAGRARVLQGDVTVLLDELWSPGVSVFADPARRTGAGRTWNPADFTPPWDWAVGLLARATAGGGVGCLKLGPGLPYRMIPEDVAAEWVSHRGDLVEVALWALPAAYAADRPASAPPGPSVPSGPSGPSGQGEVVTSTLPVAGTRTATLLDDGGAVLRLVAEDAPGPLRAPAVGSVLWEPDPAVIRAGAVDRLAELLDAGRVADEIAYLVSAAAPGAGPGAGRSDPAGSVGERSDPVGSAGSRLDPAGPAGRHPDPTRFATGFRVLEVLAAKEKVLRAWVRDHRVGRLEIKKRGVDTDPAALRRRLRPSGPNAATLVLTPTPDGARALVVERLVVERPAAPRVAGP